MLELLPEHTADTPIVTTYSIESLQQTADYLAAQAQYQHALPNEVSMRQLGPTSDTAEWSQYHWQYVDDESRLPHLLSVNFSTKALVIALTRHHQFASVIINNQSEQAALFVGDGIRPIRRQLTLDNQQLQLFGSNLDDSMQHFGISLPSRFKNVA